MHLVGSINIKDRKFELHIDLFIANGCIIPYFRASSTAEEREKKIAELVKAMAAAKEEAAAIILQVNRFNS